MCKGYNMPNLFDPVMLGSLELKNRVIMAPLTRSRAGPTRTPNSLMAQYYAQRATAGLIIAEATAISPIGYGWANAPAIYHDDHVKGWQQVTKSVHDKGGKIILQLWHMGRVSHPDFHAGSLPVAPSAIAAEGMANTPEGKKPFVTPHALTIDEIAQTVKDYACATERALEAGFDGVEIHAANSYLIDQFIRDGSNIRTDDYGGSIENRLRFLREVIETVTKIAGSGRTGIRLSPTTSYNSMVDSNPQATFCAAAEMLNQYNLAYMHIREAVENGTQPIGATMRQHFKGSYIANDGFDYATAQQAVQSGSVDAVAFGRPFVANPDLVERLRIQAPLATINMDTLYQGGPEGYIDYPAL